MSERTLSMKLVYEGAEVDGGSMPLEEVITALQGFSGAYAKVANSYTPSFSHQLRVQAVEKGSFEMAIMALVVSHPEAIEVLKTVSISAARYVFGLVKDYISAKKHTQSKTYDVSVRGDHNVVVIVNSEGEEKPFPKEVLEMLESKLIDGDLNKIASPLQRGILDKAELSAIDEDGPMDATIASEDKGYFSVEDEVQTKSEVELVGEIVSFNKESLNGIFKKVDGSKTHFRYTGNAVDSFIPFFIHKGMIRICAIAFFDPNLKLKRLEIVSASRAQMELDLGSGE